MSQPSQQQGAPGQKSLPIVIPGAQLTFTSPPPGFPPPGYPLPSFNNSLANAAAAQAQFLLAHQIVQNQLNQTALQQLTRHQPPPRLPNPAIAPPLRAANVRPSNAGLDNRTTEAKTSLPSSEAPTSQTAPIASIPFMFNPSAPPPGVFNVPPPPFAMAAVPVTINPSPAKPVPRLNIPSTRPNGLRSQVPYHRSYSTLPVSSTPEPTASATQLRRRDDQIFKVDEQQFLAENSSKIPNLKWSRCVPVEPYFYWSKNGLYEQSPHYQKLVGDFERCVLNAPERVNSSRMLEPPPRPSDLENLYISQGHHHHHHHNGKCSENGPARRHCDKDECDSDHSDSESCQSSGSESGACSSGEVSDAESGEITDSDSESDQDTNNKQKQRNAVDKTKDDERADMNAKMINAEIEWRSRHPAALHSDIWFNLNNLGNFGPTCRCSQRAKRAGFRHNIFPHEVNPPKCKPDSNNMSALRHFRLEIRPSTNWGNSDPTKLSWDEHIYIFEGFSLLVHGDPLTAIPPCSVNRYGIMYTIDLIEEPVPPTFSVSALDQISDYLLINLLNLFELDWLKTPEDGCRLVHIFPRFVRAGPDGSKELLSIPLILMHLISSFRPIVPFDRASADELASLPDNEWNNWRLAKLGQLITKPGFLPGAIRLDQVDRVLVDKESTKYDIRLCHWTTQPQQMNYLRNASYVRAWRKLMKYRYLLSNKLEITKADREKLRDLSDEVTRIQAKRSKDVTDDSRAGSKGRFMVELNPTGFYFTGLRTDITEHALFLPAVVFHLRAHASLRGLEVKLGYQFKNRALYQLALTHSSYTAGHVGTNSDHIHNTQANCGIRMPTLGDTKSSNPLKTRRKGIVQLTHLMASIDKDSPAAAIQINTGADLHNERLEFLGDAVLSFVVNRHIFFMFPNASEGTLSIYHSALVSNENFFRIAKSLGLESYMLYSHGPDLCVRSALDHAMANTVEALHGAIYLEAGIGAADEVFARLIFGMDPSESDLLFAWNRVPPHPLQAEEPNGDRHWIAKSPVLQRLTKLEDSIGIQFTHIRLLAQAMANIDTAHVLTKGNNERLEFFGDYILQLVVTDYLFHRFPKHHEGGLSLLRATLLQASTQALMAKDLNLADYLLKPRPISKKKTLADILEAFVGALYVDKGLDHVRVLCEVTLLPRLQQIVLDQSWNDPKSRLQMLCITQRDLDKEPDMPRYRVLAQMPVGPNGPRFEVAVYFRRQRLAVGVGRSKQEAEVSAARNAISAHGHEWAETQRQERLLNKVRSGESTSNRNLDFASSIDSYVEKRGNSSRGKICSARVVDLPRKRRQNGDHSESSATTSSSSDSEEDSFRFPGPCNNPKEAASISKSSKKRNRRKNRRKQ